MNYIIKSNVDLSSYNSLKLHAIASKVYFPITLEGLLELLLNSSEKKLHIIGGGSNILLTKDYYGDDEPLVITRFLDKMTFNNNYVTCESGVKLNNLVWEALSNNFEGIEFLEDIPGTIGGALLMNAGTYGKTISDILLSLRYFDRKNGKVENLIIDPKNVELFQYRNSFLKINDYIVIDATLKLSTLKDYSETVNKIINIKQTRFSKQPRNFPNAGSVFKRPKDKNGNDIYVGKLIAESGLSGLTIGNAQISIKHNGFFVNLGNAKFSDFDNLIQHTIKIVRDKFNIDLEVEWIYL